MTKDNRCRECGGIEPIHKVFEFGDSDGDETMICDDCYQQHEEKGDWVS